MKNAPEIKVHRQSTTLRTVLRAVAMGLAALVIVAGVLLYLDLEDEEWLHLRCITSTALECAARR